MESPSSTPPAGIFVPVPTFSVPAASKEYNLPTPPLDLDTQASHALHLARSGITGLVLCGSTSKTVQLARTEHVAQIKHVWAARTVGRYEDCPLIARTATNGIDETVELLNESAVAGAGWGLFLALGYFATAPSQEGIIVWYKGVLEGSSIPVMMFVPHIHPEDSRRMVEQ